MNTVLTFLDSNWQRLDLARYGAPARLSCVIVTPRFRASSHVVFLLLAEGRSEPALVAKVPRLAGASSSIEREVANLRFIQTARPGGFDSLPRVIAFEAYRGYPILIETALVGRPMGRQAVRRDLTGCCEVVTQWLTEMRPPCQDGQVADSGWFERLVEQPLNRFEKALPLLADEAQLLERTRALVAPLSGLNLPLVIEHGDLCHPNLLLLDGGGLGVIDWELAEPRGLPTYDLFFFLTYAAFAQRNARDNSQYVSAFQAAFFGRSAWARQIGRAHV